MLIVRTPGGHLSWFAVQSGTSFSSSSRVRHFSLTRTSQRPSFLIAFITQCLFDSLHDWHLKILLVAAIIRHLAHIFFQALQINHSVVAFGIIVTAEPRGDEPRLTDFVMHELVTVDFRNVDRHLGLGRPGSCKGKDRYQGDADALPWHKTSPLKKSKFSCGAGEGWERAGGSAWEGR